MAFQQSNAQRESKKILEELQLKKQLLLKQGVAATLNSTALPVLGTANVTNSDSHVNNMSTSQRNTQQQTASQYTGFLIPQDSAFGNSMLPVIPRLDNK